MRATLTLLAVSWIPSFSLAADEDGKPLRVVVIGDMGTGRPDQHQVAATLTTRAKLDAYDLALTLGDNFYPRGVQSAEDPQWTTAFEDVYNDPALDIPFFASLGNHDHLGVPTAQVDYAKREGRWRMPARWYAFEEHLADGGSAAFFALDTQALRASTKDREAQVAWLDGRLAASEAEWTIVYGHHPPFTHGHHDGSRTMRNHVVPVLARHGADLHLSGHNHHLELLEPKDGVTYAVSGAAAGLDKSYETKVGDDTVFIKNGGGFLELSITSRELVMVFVGLDGSELHTHRLQARARTRD